MPAFSVVPFSQVEHDQRMDADFYHPVYLDELPYWHRLEERVGTVSLGRVISAPVRTGRTPKAREIVPGEPCIRFIKTDTVREGSINFDDADLLPMRVVTAHDVIPDQAVVVTIIGATAEIVGRAAIVRSDDPECVTNQNVAVINTQATFDPYFLVAYLQTKWGRNQIWKQSRRTGQVNLNCREVERILVPNPDPAYRGVVGDLVQRA